jgi:hypothetical protein
MAIIRSGVIVCLALAVVGSPLSASGPVGIYGIVERVVFEPNETAPERVQVWGAFVYANGCSSSAAWAAGAPVECGVLSARAAENQRGGVSPVSRGYLYFKLPAVVPDLTTEADVDLVKREWADLKAVAGTGQAVGFGRWGYIGSFSDIRPDRPARVYENVLRPTGYRGGDLTDLRVRPASEAPVSPATYQTNAGVVRLSDRGGHADIVAQLRSRLR